MKHRIVPNLWFDTQAEEAAAFYVSVFGGDSRFIAINGGPQFTFDEAVSFQIDCETQDEVDRFWEALTEGGEELLNDPDPERGRQAMDAMLAMRKLDIAALRAAADGDVPA